MDHLKNILKILSVDDYDEIVAHRLYIYCEWQKLLDFNMGVEDGDYDVEEVKQIINMIDVNSQIR